MEPIGVTVARSAARMVEPDRTGLDSLQFNEEIRHLMTAPSDNASSFTALLELPPTQAMELLHSPQHDPVKPLVNDNNVSFQNADVITGGGVQLPCNSTLIERAAKFSVSANAAMAENFSPSPPESSSVPSNSSVNLDKVKSEPTDLSQAVAENNRSQLNSSQRSAKRKEREKKVKGSNKKSKRTRNESEDAEKLPYVHVRARRGQATDSHSLAERARREKINQRMKLLQDLVPGCNKISGTALVLDEIINHVQSLQRQVEFLSMRLAAVNPRVDFNLDSIMAAESGSLMDSNYPSAAMPLMWLEVQANGDRQQYQQQQWNFDGLHQPVWGREDNHHNFITPENSLLSYDSANSASLHSTHQLKMEL